MRREVGARAEHRHRAGLRQRRDLGRGREFEMVGTARSQLGRDVRAVTRPQLRSVDAKQVAQSLGPAEQRAGFGRRERWCLTPRVAEDRPRRECGKHFIDQRAQVGLPLGAGRNDMGAEEGRHHPQPGPLGQLPKDIERLGLVVEVEPIPRLGFDGGGAVGEKPVGPRFGKLKQGRSLGRPGQPHGSRDRPTAAPGTWRRSPVPRTHQPAIRRRPDACGHPPAPE